MVEIITGVGEGKLFLPLIRHLPCGIYDATFDGKQLRSY
jgi:hypothetical protein